MFRNISDSVLISRKGKLFRRYFLIISLIALICVTVVVLVLFGITSSYWMDARENSLQEAAISMAHTAEDLAASEGEDFNLPAVENMRAQLCTALSAASKQANSDIYICNMDGTVLLCQHILSDTSGDFDDNGCEIHDKIQFPNDFIETLVAQKTFSMRGTYKKVYEEPTFLAATVIYIDGIAGFVVAAQPMNTGMQDYLRAFIKIFFIAILVALLTSSLVSYIFTFNITRPLTEMAHAMKQYSEGEFSRRLEVKGNDEITTLAETFNKMADSLAMTENSRRSFIANVSHELKTPMTSISGFVDGILDGTIPPEKEKYYLKIVSDETKRLSRLIVSMLNMSKMEAGEIQIKPSKFNISDLIFNALIQFEKTINDKDIEIEGLDKFNAIPVRADIDMINQVLYNIIDNAVKFTPQGEKISVFAESKNGEVTVSIRNHGVGLSESECKMVFDRFYKIDKSRSFDINSVGLGLYITKTIIEMHKGTIVCRSDGATYTEFSFTIPEKAYLGDLYG